MTTTYKLGEIPPQSVWEGETLTFTVTSSLGAGTTFSESVSVPLHGSLTLDAMTGAFSYAPSAEDKEQFAVWITARKDATAARGELGQKQKILITPQPRLPSDFNSIQHVGASPDPRSPSYIIYDEQSAGKMVFNNRADYEDKDVEKVKIEIKQVTVSGIQIVLEANNPTYPLFDRLHNKTDIKRLTLCADQVIVKSALNLPGTDVHIYANSLKFEGAGSFNTTPIALETRAEKRADGLKGQKGGDVYLFIGAIDKGPGMSSRFITNGAPGQAARLGEAGAPGQSYTPWNGKAITPTRYNELFPGQDFKEELDWSSFFKPLGDYEPVYVKIYAFFRALKEEDREHLKIRHGTEAFPTNGTPPKVTPGSPGQGGDSGSVFMPPEQFFYIRRRITQQVGATGEMAKDIAPAPAGTPRKSCHVKAVYEPWLVKPLEKDYPKKKGDGDLNRRRSLEILEANGKKLMHETQDGPGATAPGPLGDAPKQGGLPALPAAEAIYWLKLVRAALPYAHDSLLAGQREDARKMLEMCRETMQGKGLDKCQGLNEADYAESTSLSDEVTALLARTDSPYDYFGNPAGWVPMLSFETNLKLYQREIEDAIRTLFLVYWMENTDKRQEKARITLQEAVTQLKTESEQAAADYNLALGQVKKFNEQTSALVVDINKFTADLQSTYRDLKRLTKLDLQAEKRLRASAKILGGVMQLIPYGQPVLGAVGKSAIVSADIDLDQPTKSLPSLAGAWTEVAEQKLVPKITELWNSLDDAKADEEANVKGDGKPKAKDDTKAKGKDDGKGKGKDDKTKDGKKGEDEFDKALAKKQLAARVANRLKEKTAAKGQVMSAFSSFAVSDKELDARLEKVLADSPEYQKLKKNVQDLNQRKKRLAEQLKAALETIDRSATTLINNQLARLELRSQLDATIDQLNGEALHYARGMGQRARHRLVKYQYYLLKSYHYLMLQEMSGVDFRAHKMFDAFAKMLASSPDGILTKNQYDSLKVVFEDQLKQITNAIIEWYETHPTSLKGQSLVSLTADQLATLNADGRLDLDLMDMDYLDLTQEDIRITDIKATKRVKLDSPPANQASNVKLSYRHGGTSRLRRGGKLYLFRSGDYSIAGTKDETSPTKYRDDHMFWGDDVTNDSNGKQKITPRVPDPATLSLLRYLIGEPKDDADAKNVLLSYRPSAWSTLTILRSATPRTYSGKLEKLELKVRYVSYNVDNSLATVFVKAPGEAEPLIQCNTVDVNERKDGRGTFLRSFDMTVTPKVTLTAPAFYGRQKFQGWKINNNPLPDTHQILTLDFKLCNVYEVTPIYDPTHSLPVDDDADKWPFCPAGWVFSEWLLVNKTKHTINLQQYSIAPTWTSLPLSVNLPVGDTLIRLAFEKLVLAPGEETKISVCANPASREVHEPQEISFHWDVGQVTQNPMRYQFWFNIKGVGGHLCSARAWYPEQVNKLGQVGANDLKAFTVDHSKNIITIVH